MLSKTYKVLIIQLVVQFEFDEVIALEEEVDVLVVVQVHHRLDLCTKRHRNLSSLFI